MIARKMFPEGSIHHLIICDHIGDFLITMGYVNAFKVSHGIEALTIYVAPKMESLARRYMGEQDRVVCLNRRKLEAVLYLTTSHQTNDWIRKRGNLWIMEPTGHFNDKCFRFMLPFPGMTLRRIIQYGCLLLPEVAEFKPLPLNPYLKKGKEGGGRVVLCPTARAYWIEKVPLHLWEKLAEVLCGEGAEVYTNLAISDEKKTPLQGTKPLMLSLEDLETWLAPNDYMIGLRSGLMDFAAYLDCRQICLYPPKSGYGDFFSLDMLPQTRSRYIEYELTDNLEWDILEIMSIMKSFAAEVK